MGNRHRSDRPHPDERRDHAATAVPRTLVEYVSSAIYKTVYPLLAVVSHASVTWLRVNPYHGLLAFVATSHLWIWFFKATSHVLPTVYTALIPTVLTAFLYLATLAWAINPHSHRRLCALDLIVAGFMFLSCVQIFNRYISVPFGLRAFQRTAFFAGMYYVGRYVIRSETRARAVAKFMAITVAIAGSVAILQSIAGSSLEGRYLETIETYSGQTAVALAQNRSYGTLASQASFGVLVTIGVLCSLAWLLDSRKSRQLPAWVCLFLNSFGLILSGSRSAMLGLMAGVVTLMWRLIDLRAVRRSKLRKAPARIQSSVAGIVFMAILTSVTILTISTPTTSTALRRLRTLSPAAWITGETIQDRNLQARLSIWQGIWEGIRQRPIIGYGTGILGGSSKRMDVGTVNGYTTADNQYIELWGELGLGGLLNYCAILWSTRKMGKQKAKTNISSRIFPLLTGSIAMSFAVVGIGAPPLDMYPSNAFFWVLLGGSVSLACQHRRSATRSRQFGK